LWEKSFRISEGTKERIIRRGSVIKTRTLHLVIPAKRAFVSGPAPLALPEVSSFVIPAKRAGGPRELESMA